VDRQETAYTAWETLSVMGSIGETNNDKAVPSQQPGERRAGVASALT
jgi:hypothetical protein